MKYYEKLLELGCFDRKRLEQLTGSPAAAADLIYNYQKKGYIERVKRDLYAVISLETKQPLWNRYQIASALFTDACVSHHSAFEMYGYANQIFYECYVATASRFSDFEYDGVTYHRVDRKEKLDVTKMGDAAVTGLEQTVTDSIRDYEKIAGFEEVLRCLLMIPELNENRLKICLENCGNGFLYQKCGYILEQLQPELKISDEFLAMCGMKISGSKRQLIKGGENMVYHARWKLYAPESLRKVTDKGGY